MEPGSVSDEVVRSADQFCDLRKIHRESNPLIVKAFGYFRGLHRALNGVVQARMQLFWRGHIMDARAIAETVLLALIAVTAGALVPDLFRYIKVGQVKYGRRGTDR